MRSPRRGARLLLCVLERQDDDFQSPVSVQVAAGRRWQVGQRGELVISDRG